MARSLLRHGHHVRLFNRTRSKAEEAAQAGGDVVDTPAEAARDADVLVTMLADPAAVVDVAEGPNGYLTGVRRGAVVIDSSTVSPATTARVARALAERDAHILDAPVFGSKGEAERGELGFIVGGDRQVLESVADVFASMGKTFYVGGSGMGCLAKLVVNSIIATTLQSFNEGMLLATRAGIAPDVMYEVIQSSRARSGIIEMKGPQVLKRDFSPFFPLHLMHKDLGLALDTANASKVPVFLLGALRQVYAACMAQGLGQEDFCASIKLLEQLADTQVGAAPSEAAAR
jgi:3-hydroxyisobutyrate dehydrogenase-like beta-hydroxyacid dehydrogenase